VLGDEHTARIGDQVPNTLEVGRALALDGVDRDQDPAAVEREDDRNRVDPASFMDGGQYSVPCRREPRVAGGFVEPGSTRFVQIRP
jgi:hypothetical protein